MALSICNLVRQRYLEVAGRRVGGQIVLHDERFLLTFESNS
jgi:hypothetical protein